MLTFFNIFIVLQNIVFCGFLVEPNPSGVWIDVPPGRRSPRVWGWDLGV